MRFSVIIPVYNRPDELAELLDSLTKQTYADFEVIVVEDGSVNRADGVVKSFQNRLKIQYFFKENAGQGFARNDGFRLATGDYFVIFDSDALVPPQYLKTVADHLQTSWLDAYGGPDAAHPDFTPVQKAISYAMTSPFTTGGIRGSAKNLGGADLNRHCRLFWTQNRHSRQHFKEKIQYIGSIFYCDRMIVRLYPRRLIWGR